MNLRLWFRLMVSRELWRADSILLFLLLTFFLSRAYVAYREIRKYFMLLILFFVINIFKSWKKASYQTVVLVK